MGPVSHWATKSIINESKTPEFYKIFSKTIGQSHENHKLHSESII